MIEQGLAIGDNNKKDISITTGKNIRKKKEVVLMEDKLIEK